MTGEGALRVRALLDRQFEVVVLALVVLAGVGGFLAYDAYAQPNTSVQTNEVTVWAADGSFTHGATVTENESRLAGVFEPGQRVANRSVYYTSLMPELSGEFGFQYAAESGEVDATIRQTLVIRSVGQTRDGEQVEYWRQTESLGSENATLGPGERIGVPYTVSVSTVQGRADRISDQLDDPGQTQVSVNVTVALTGTAGGEAVDRTVQYALPLSTEGRTYRVDAMTGGASPATRTERTTVVADPGALSAYGGPVLLLLSLAGLAGLVYVRSTGRLVLTDAERAWLAYRDDRSDFDDWISTVRLPNEARDLPVAEAATLADLVDFAIDTDEAVLAAPDDRQYHVVHDGYRYTFEAPPEPESAPLLRTDRSSAETPTAEEGVATRETTIDAGDGGATTGDGDGPD
jgi:hypothetical protein